MIRVQLGRLSDLFGLLRTHEEDLLVAEYLKFLLLRQ
jgi:hypothetical protein